MEGFLQKNRNLHCKNRSCSNTVQCKWKAPDENFIKINVDGAFSEDGAGVGVVVSNHLGQTEAVLAEKFPDGQIAEHV